MLDLHKLRKDFDLSQAQLAKIANSSVRSIGNWERGEKSIDLATILKIAQTLEIPVIEFFHIYLVVEDSSNSNLTVEQNVLNEINRLGEKLTNMSEQLTYVYEYIAEKSAAESLETLKINIEKKRVEKPK